MTLSPKVSRPPAKTSPVGRPLGRRPNSPFAGINRTSADIRRAPRARSAAEMKRSTSGREKPQKERETFHALKMQKALSPISYGQRTSIKSRIQDTDSFEDFPLLPIVQDSIASQALSGMVDITPTPIQSLAIPVLLGNESRANRRRAVEFGKKEMEQFLLAAETGSGKTLAYLVPVLDAMKRAEAIEAVEESRRKAREEEEKKNMSFHAIDAPPLSDAPHPTTGRPRAIILLPTSELVTQVGSVAKLLSHKIKFRSAMISTAYTSKVIRNRLFATTGIDILISTPHLLASISESDPNVLSRVTHLVIDEADSLLDRSFAPSTSTIIDKSTPSLRQLILCSATIPRSLDSYLRTRFPDMRRLVTPNLHAIPRRVQLGVVDVEKQPYNGNKLLACADTIWSIGKAANESTASDRSHADIKRLLVFVNEREKSQEVAEYLVSKGIDAVALNRDTPEQRQRETLAEFTSISKGEGGASPSSSLAEIAVPPSGHNYKPLSFARDPVPLQAPRPKRQLPNTKVLVSTDLGSRGIDTLAVRHVVLYDVPHTTVDFIHRLGRTGRMGRRGRGIVLVGKNDRRDVVREVREGMYKGQALI
ncbi:MAG: hypothetical protein Q9164_002397 [Protoblastenia rupestris]